MNKGGRPISYSQQCDEFNQEVQSSRAYMHRKQVLSTPIIFWDNPILVAPPFLQPKEDWCLISPSLKDRLTTSREKGQIIKFENDVEELQALKPIVQEEWRQEVPKLLMLLANLYIDHSVAYLQFEIDINDKEKNEIIAKARQLVNEQHEKLFAEESIVAFLQKTINMHATPNTTIVSTIKTKRTKAEQLQQLQETHAYSVRDICSILHISSSSYYSLSKKRQLPEANTETTTTPKLVRSYLCSNEILFLKNLADRPNKSYTVPEMQQEFIKKFKFPVTRKTIYYHLTKTLNYSYKRNRFKAARAFRRGQWITNYEVSREYLRLLERQYTFLWLDESGFDLGTQAEYSYAKKGEHPVRIGRRSAAKLHVLMAISTTTIFAYSVRQGGHNEHSFLAFLLDLINKLLEKGIEALKNTVLFMDNASFHTSYLAMKLYKLLPCTILFNAPYWSDMNPIESIFGLVKKKLKKDNSSTR